ncbi:hypothetical protein ONZ45_g12029 [Pleurotus djamor]|nr:hypothetical protein ONZ45_g12029 [Pleurotus djamor]
MAANFTSVPILDWSLATNPTTKDKFILQLRHAVVNVGFLYLANSSISKDTIDAVMSYIPQLFALPQDAKDKIRMANSEHFLGYSRLGAELTKGKTDIREQFDFATPHASRWKAGDPDHYRLWGPSQWPDEDLIPGFKVAMEKYLLDVQELSYAFSRLLSEALGLPSDGLFKFFDRPELMQHRGKVVKYPTVDPSSLSDQGVGPHYDAGFITILLQASPHEGLQVQNLAGEWIDAPPIPGTFIINFGKALEFVTRGLARATSHRVLSPKGQSPRYSVPFFQNISLDARLADSVLDFSPEVLALRELRGDLSSTDSVNFTEFDREPSGQVNLIGRVKSHPDVAQRHYPDLFKQVFPEGLPAQGFAY